MRGWPRSRCGGGIHSVSPLARLRVFQPPLDQPVVGPADEREVAHVGRLACGVIVDVVDLAKVAGYVAAAPRSRWRMTLAAEVCEQSIAVQRYCGPAM